MFKRLFALAALAVVACAHDVAPSSAFSEAAVAAALAHPDRPGPDRDSDARRKAAETLAFFQVAPGETVIDMEAGAGFWTEPMARVVGPEGSVVLQNPQGFINFLGERLNQRMADGRLPNVSLRASTFDSLGAADGTVDLVTWVQGPHELYYTPETGEPLGDVAGTYAEIARVLKPGGRFVVIDHAATPGAPETTGGTLHRIDPAIIIGLAEAAGLVLEARGDFLANPEDDHTLNVFDPAIRGRTDQFALRFRKPA